MLDFIERHDVTDDYGNVLYNVTTVARVMNTPTWFAASDTATVSKVPAKPKPTEAFAALREKFGAQFDAMPEPKAQYGIPTSTDRIDALEAQVKQQAATIAALEAYIRDHSERDDVPFGTLRMAEDAQVAA